MVLPIVLTGLLVFGCLFVLYLLDLHLGIGSGWKKLIVLAFAVLIAAVWVMEILGNRDAQPDRTSSTSMPAREPEPAATPPPEEEEPEPVKQCTPRRGTAKFYGTKKVSAEGRVVLRVRGKRITQVVFFTDGKRRRTDRVRPFVYRLKATSLKTKNGRKYGKHAVRAQVKYAKCTTESSPRKLRKIVRRVNPPPPPPPEPVVQPAPVKYTPPQQASAPAASAPAPQPQVPAPSQAPAPRSTPPPSSGGTTGPSGPDPAPPVEPRKPDPCCDDGNGTGGAGWDTSD